MYVLVIIVIFWTYLLFTYTPDVTFLSKRDMLSLLLNDEDGYYQGFSSNDLKIRGVQSLQEYSEAIKASVCEGDAALKKKIKQCIRKIQGAFMHFEEIQGVDFPVFLELPWKIGFVCGSQYENGYPHTRMDTIVLKVSDHRTETQLCRLLIHEQVHVYQKKFPEKIQTFLKKYQKDVPREAPANPDIDQQKYIYFFAKYSHDPSSFADIEYAHQQAKYEHPLELMAYEVERLYL